jgi:hypothetical protein|nr:hypothetical protein [Neorhizobium tomejilense]
MKYIRFFLLAGVVQIGLSVAAQAAEKCYEEIPIPTSLLCADSNSRSADFSSGCEVTPATTEKKEIDCPATWVNISGDVESHATTCARVGLRPTDIDGAKCAAGERRPTTGGNFNGISYKFGRWGGSTQGGSIIQFLSRTVTSGFCRDCDRKTTTYTYNYCWNPGNKRDNDSTDIVVAYACKK